MSADLPFEELPPVGSGVDAAPHGAGDQERWQRELDDYIHGPIDQDPGVAQAWLAALGTILGLAGTVIAVKGPSTFAGVTENTAVEVVLAVSTVAVFLLALGAVGLAASATWGGLRPTNGSSAPAGWRTAVAALLSLLQRLTARYTRLQEIFAWAGNEADEAPESQWTAQRYEEYVRDQADQRRNLLHRSRLLGLTAGFFAGALVLAALVLAAFTSRPASADPTVIAVHAGQISCGILSHDANGDVLVSGHRLTAVTEILITDHC